MDVDGKSQRLEDQRFQGTLGSACLEQRLWFHTPVRTLSSVTGRVPNHHSWCLVSHCDILPPCPPWPCIDLLLPGKVQESIRFQNVGTIHYCVSFAHSHEKNSTKLRIEIIFWGSNIGSSSRNGPFSAALFKYQKPILHSIPLHHHMTQMIFPYHFPITSPHEILSPSPGRGLDEGVVDRQIDFQTLHPPEP